MNEIHLYKQPWKGLKIITLTLPFVLLGIFLIYLEPSDSKRKIIGWITALIFSLGVPVGLFQTLDRRPQIKISKNGIWDRTTNQNEILWGQIKRAYPLSINKQRFVSLELNSTFIPNKKPYRWASKINEFVGAQDVNLFITQLDIDEVKLTNFINEMIQTEEEQRPKIIRKYF